jgi:hypothetical protein
VIGSDVTRVAATRVDTNSKYPNTPFVLLKNSIRPEPVPLARPFRHERLRGPGDFDPSFADITKGFRCAR